RRYSSSSPPVSAPPPRYRRESSPMAPVDRLLRADRPSQTVPPAACPHQRTPVAPSWPPRIIAVTSEIRTGQRQELFFEAPLSLAHAASSARPELRLLRLEVGRPDHPDPFICLDAQLRHKFFRGRSNRVEPECH